MIFFSKSRDLPRRFPAGFWRFWDNPSLTDYTVFTLYFSDAEDSDDEIGDDEEMFKQCDIDGDGFITHDELKKFVLKRHNSVTDFEISKMIKQFDIDGDGKISYEEYQTMMLQR